MTVTSSTRIDIHSASDAVVAWRTQALNLILYVGMAIGPFIIGLSVINQLDEPLLVAFYLGILGLLALVTFVKRIRYEARAVVMLTVPFAAGIVDLYEFGPDSDARTLLLAAIVLSTLFLGKWGGLIMLGGSIVVMVPEFVRASDSLYQWLSPILVFLAFGLVLVIAITSLIARLSQSLDAAANAHIQAEQARQQAEQAAQQTQEQMALVEQQYQTERQLRELVSVLETPTVGLANGVLLAPIVGTIDSQRAQLLTERLLAAVHTQHVRTMIIDLAGVATVDTQVARTLMQVVQALQLLGCRVVLTGISAHVATMLTRLDIDLENVTIAHSPQEILHKNGNGARFAQRLS